MTIPPYPQRLTLITVLYGMLIFVWLTPEDSVWFVSLLGTGLALVITAHGVFRWAGATGRTLTGWTPQLGAILMGGTIGALASICTVGLMFLKTALHNHIYPEYPLPVLLGILTRLPPWTLAGALIGLGIALWITARQQQHQRPR